MYKRPLLVLAALLSIVLAPAAQARDTPHWVHYRLIEKKAQLPKKILIVPARIKTYEVTAGGVKEEVPEWSREAAKNVLKAVGEGFSKDGRMQVVALPSLSASEQATLDEYIALYKLVAASTPNRSMMHKIRRFDYGIGPGLAPILARAGADAVVMVYGQDYASTAGRKAKAAIGKIPLVGLLAGGETELGHAFVHIGLIELRSGDLLWMNSQFRDDSTNLRDYDDVQDMMKAIFKWYPGIDEYREEYVDD